MALESTEPLTEMNSRNLPGVKGRPARKTDNLTAIYEPDCLGNVGASTSHNPVGFYGLLQGQLYLFSSVAQTVSRSVERRLMSDEF
jgi:hypothetical protein